jgi:hypothetical protein
MKNDLVHVGAAQSDTLLSATKLARRRTECCINDQIRLRDGISFNIDSLVLAVCRAVWARSSHYVITLATKAIELDDVGRLAALERAAMESEESKDTQ